MEIEFLVEMFSFYALKLHHNQVFYTPLTAKSER